VEVLFAASGEVVFDQVTPQLLFQADELGKNRTLIDAQASDGYRQMEATRSRAARIKVEQALDRLLLGYVRVAADNRAVAHSGWIKPKFLQVVDDVDLHVADLQHGILRQFPRPRLNVNVPAHGSNGSDLLQGGDDRGITDISGVDDVVGAAQSIKSLCAKQAMRVGDDADDYFRRL
jgi:hypothetical protein